MAKQIYIDSNGNEILVSGTIINDNNLPHYTGTPTAGTTAEAIAYSVGDILDINLTIFAGELINNSKRIRFYIPLEKIVNSNVNDCELAGNFSVYGVNGSSTVTNSSSTGTWTFSVTPRGVFCQFDLNTALSITNNTVISVAFAGGAPTLTLKHTE